MGVYSRFKKDPNGFRNLVSLLETTGPAKREKMIEAGMAEDPDYTRKALLYCISFDDVLALPDSQLAEVVVKAPPRALAFAIQPLAPEVHRRFLQYATPRIRTELNDFLEMENPPETVIAARLKVVGVVRQLEQRGLVKLKKIPPNIR